MSQSDYIQFKKTAIVLKNDELPAVLNPTDYTSFESYNLETTVQNTKNTYSRLVLSGNKQIFDMEKKVSGCATFPLCTNTNLRANRVLNTGPKILPSNGLSTAYKPDPTYRINKVFTPTTCRYLLQKGKVTRTVWCGKETCKCGTRIYNGELHP